MSPRVTRSATRLAEGSSAAAAPQTSASSTHVPSKSRKRKAPPESSPASQEDSQNADDHKPPKAKKTRTSKRTSSPPSPPTPLPTASRKRSTRQSKSMAKPGPSPSATTGEKEKSPPPISETSRRKSSGRSKKTESDTSPVVPTTSSTSKRSKKNAAKKIEDVPVPEPSAITKSSSTPGEKIQKHGESSDEDDDVPPGRKYQETDDDGGWGGGGPSGGGLPGGAGDRGDPFRGSFLAGAGGLSASMSSTLRALSGYVSGVSQRLRDILEKLRQKDDPSVQYIALQDLSEILLVSNEDNLSGHFSPDQFVKELITLMQPNELGEENPEMMLVACRCIANLMEALPQSTGNVVYGGAVPILCQKLLEIHYIDLAEQALSTLEKISVEFPASIVREGGLTACLTYLDFFATSTQRTAVMTAANCCKNIPQDSFPVIRDVMPILLRVLSSSNDQKVVEQGSICVSRVVESFKYQQDKLEELVSVDLLKAIRRLLQPGTTNLIGPNIHTQFLRVLSISAHSSPKLSAELLKLAIVDTTYQILTGVSPPNGVENVTSQIDSVFIMQALIHRPREQISETLNVICDLLPAVQLDSLSFYQEVPEDDPIDNISIPRSETNSKEMNNLRLELLQGCQEELKRFAIVLFPTLTDAYSSTVNLGVRQRVLTAQLKMISNLDVAILEDALRSVPYASHLASILSQEDHPSLVTAALKAADLLLNRLLHIYGYQFYREGVMAEIFKLASKTVNKTDSRLKLSKGGSRDQLARTESIEIVEELDHEKDVEAGPDHDDSEAEEDGEHNDDEPDNDEDDEDDDEDEDEDGEDGEDGGPRIIREEDSPSPSESSASDRPYSRPSFQSDEDLNITRARKFLEVHETAKSKGMRDEAASILKALRSLSASLHECFLGKGENDAKCLFSSLSKYFQGNAYDTITSSELLQSDVVDTLLQVFSHLNNDIRIKSRVQFTEVFMHSTHEVGPTPFSVFIHKLQDLLSRAEHFEVVTIHHNASDNNRSSPTSMLSKQLRIRLMGEDDTETPKPFRHQMISIHAIATFKALEDYLRPRLSMDDRHKGPRSREGISNALAAFAAAAGMPNTHYRLGERLSTLGAGVAVGEGSGSATPSPSTNNNINTPASKGSRKVMKSRGASSMADTKDTPKDNPPASRRSSRRHQRSAVTPATTPSAPVPGRSQTPLECADERQLSEEEDIDDASALDAIVDDLEDGMDSEQSSEPTAVNMEVAATGKVTARKEDGTRVATPAQSTTPSAPRDASSRRNDPLGGITSSGGPRGMSYAAAIQSVPQDWHLEFSINDQPVPGEMTIYRAVQDTITSPPELNARNIWSAIHVVKFKRVPGPPPSETAWASKNSSAAIQGQDSEMPVSLNENPTTSKILRLLNILHEINANLEDVLEDGRASSTHLSVEPVSQFVNTKLTAKLNRQLEEPLIVASNCLPSWTQDLTRLYPFLFPFETRHLFLQSTSFGYARSMTRWQNQTIEDTRRDRHRDERPFQGRLQRQKVRISRTRILESAQKVMELYGGSSSVLEVEYFGEVGTGLGPTLEFYSTVSKEFSKKKIKMWRENDSNQTDEHAFGKQGLFPAPMTQERAETESGKRTLHHFKMLGKFIARSMLDSRIIDVSLNPTLFRLGDPPKTVPLSLGAVKSVDADLAKSLKALRQYANAKKNIEDRSNLTEKQKIKAIRKIEFNGATVDDLSLDFTLPGYPQIELIPDGSNVSVTIDNLASYVDKVVDMTLGSGVKAQMDHFQAGFSEVFAYSALKAFTPSELVMLFGRVEEDWSIETLLDSIKADHGFNMDSKSVKNLLQVMSELTPPQRRDFLQFVTGSPKLPIGGFKALNPMFTVVCKPSEPPYTSDDFLISVMTCANYVKLPDYSSVDILRERLLTAIQEGQGAFHLS